MNGPADEVATMPAQPVDESAREEPEIGETALSRAPAKRSVSR